jgi:hypothetical protein
MLVYSFKIYSKEMSKNNLAQISFEEIQKISHFCFVVVVNLRFAYICILVQRPAAARHEPEHVLWHRAVVNMNR